MYYVIRWVKKKRERQRESDSVCVCERERERECAVNCIYFPRIIQFVKFLSFLLLLLLHYNIPTLKFYISTLRAGRRFSQPEYINSQVHYAYHNIIQGDSYKGLHYIFYFIVVFETKHIVILSYM